MDRTGSWYRAASSMIAFRRVNWSLSGSNPPLPGAAADRRSTARKRPGVPARRASRTGCARGGVTGKTGKCLWSNPPHHAGECREPDIVRTTTGVCNVRGRCRTGISRRRMVPTPCRRPRRGAGDAVRVEPHTGRRPPRGGRASRGSSKNACLDQDALVALDFTSEAY